MSQRNIRIITFIVIGLLIVVPVGFYIYNQAQKEEIAKKEQPLVGESYIDPVSGESLTKSDREHESASKVITLIGFNNLIDLGLSMDQYGQLEDKFTLLSDKLAEPITRATMYNGSGEKTSRDEGESRTWVMNFNMQLNEKDDYAGTVEYTSITQMTLKVYNKDRTKLLYTL